MLEPRPRAGAERPTPVPWVGEEKELVGSGI